MSDTGRAAHGQTCEFCGDRIPRGAGHVGLVPDLSVIDKDNPDLDGYRMIFACGSDHLDRLILRNRYGWVHGRRDSAAPRAGGPSCEADPPESIQNQ
jgi:hypothetical protein